MIKSFVVSLILFFTFVSCGIPDFPYISGPTSTVNNTFTVNTIESEEITGFEFYGRYYLDSQSPTKDKFSQFDDGVILDTVDFLENQGFYKIEFSNVNNLTDILEQVKVLSNTVSSYSLVYESSGSTGFTIKNTVSEEEFYLGMKYLTDNLHYIGYYDDENGYGSDFLSKLFSGETSDPNSFFIEIAVVNIGISNTVSRLESVPLYLGSYEIQNY